MLHLSLEASNISEVNAFLSTHRVQESVLKSKSVLVQVFASEIEGAFVEQLNASITKAVPSAVIIGTTTSGEIIKGRSVKNSTVLSFSFFEEAEVKAIAMDCPQGHEQETGEILAKKVMKSSKGIKGVLLLATTQTVNGGELLDGIRSAIGSFPLFGAGAGCYDYNNRSFIFYGDKIYKEGVIAVVFSGETLNIKVYTYLGWQALSREMTVTEVYNHLLVKKIDDTPAALVYEKYLKIDKNDNFFHKVIEFPLMVVRDGCELARIPAACLKDGSMCFGADIRKGEKVRLAYGNPERIIMNSYVTQRLMEEFSPQGIFLYSCICRQIFLQESIQLETLPFQDIAHTSGFYTYGEFYGSGKNINMLNGTIVAVGFREGDNKSRKVNKTARVKPVVDKESLNINLSTRLAYFAEAVVAELEDANRKLQALSNTDILTKLYNRGKIDSILKSEIERAKKEKNNLSVILIDIDDFKSVNDLYGHFTGDTVLQSLANILKSSIRSTDIIGRWGGEEFMIILPDTDLHMAKALAERIRKTLSKTYFNPVGNITASFGVITAAAGEEEIDVYKRVDAALYEAKGKGRNRVVVG